MEARDWEGVADLVAEDFVLEWPAERVQIRGRENFVGFNRTYPEGWSIEVLHVLAQGDTAVSELRVTHPAVGPFYAVSFLEVQDGRLARGREYWLEERYQEPAPERARWFENMDG